MLLSISRICLMLLSISKILLVTILDVGDEISAVGGRGVSISENFVAVVDLQNWRGNYEKIGNWKHGIFISLNPPDPPPTPLERHASPVISSTFLPHPLTCGISLPSLGLKLGLCLLVTFLMYLYDLLLQYADLLPISIRVRTSMHWSCCFLSLI